MENDTDQGPSAEQKIQVIHCTPRPCAYFNDREERLILLTQDIRQKISLDRLYNAGFRRYGQDVCLINCKGCNACKLLRLDTSTFTPSKSQKRVKAKNSDLTRNVIPAQFKQQHFDLFVAYTANRHQSPSDSPTSREMYEYNILFEHPSSYLAELHDKNGDLLAVCSFDLTSTAIMLHQSFYDVINHPKRSLGTMVVLEMLQFAIDQGIKYVYLGHWVSGHEKMRYKTNFRPFELLNDNAWLKIS